MGILSYWWSPGPRHSATLGLDLQQSVGQRSTFLGIGSSCLLDSSMGIPRWAGFTIGYHIAAAYLLRHRATTTVTLATLSAASILAGSNYST
jgi:uncharacterized protein YjaZ